MALLRLLSLRTGRVGFRGALAWTAFDHSWAQLWQLACWR